MPADPLPLILIATSSVLLMVGLVRAANTEKFGMFFGGFAGFAVIAFVYLVPTWVMALRASTPQDEFEVAEAYSRRGGGLFANHAAAAAWYERAAERGHLQAQFEIGVDYLHGHGIPKNPANARRWLEKAAAQGHGYARIYLRDFDEELRVR